MTGKLFFDTFWTYEYLTNRCSSCFPLNLAMFGCTTLFVSFMPFLTLPLSPYNKDKACRALSNGYRRQDLARNFRTVSCWTKVEFICSPSAVVDKMKVR